MSHEVISLTDDSDSERVSGNSHDDMTSSMDSFDAFLLDDDTEEDHTTVPMPYPILSA